MAVAVKFTRGFFRELEKKSKINTVKCRNLNYFLLKMQILGLGRTFDRGNKKTPIYGPPVHEGVLY